MSEYFPETTVGWCGVAFGAVMFFLFLWSRREQRRSRTLKAAAQFRLWGATDIAELFEAYTIGNYLGRKSITRVLHKMIDKAKVDGVPKMFAELASKITDHLLTTIEGRKMLREKLEKAEKVASLTEENSEEPIPTVVEND